LKLHGLNGREERSERAPGKINGKIADTAARRKQKMELLIWNIAIDQEIPNSFFKETGGL
jgi:hypothetical protein